MENSKSHWETIYSTKSEQEVSWFQEYPKTSMMFLELFDLPLDANIIDIGGGDSHFVDALLEKGYRNIWVLDISAAAIERAKKRLGEKAGQVHWVVSDVTEFEPPVPFDFWHDRAAFHFLTTDEAVHKYVAIAENGIRQNGILVLGTFSENGPKKCSGLEIRQYDEASMSARFEVEFERIKCITEDHATPFNTVQNFLFCSFKKKGTQHRHIFDKDGKQLCCTLEEKIYTNANAANLLKEQHSDDDGHDHDHDHSGGESHGVWRQYLPAIVSLTMLLLGIALDHYIPQAFFKGWLRVVFYVVAYLPVGFPVMKEAFQAIAKGEFFTEFTLMALATVGAFAIGEYPEGVAVMLFYAIGELFQSAAVNRAKSNIKALLDVRPAFANLFKNGNFQQVKPETVEIGDIIQVRSGEKVPLDSELISEKSTFNTAALTGESKPKSIEKGETVLAGMLNLDKVIELRVTKKYADSSLARILDMVQNATARKAQTELLIRRFAKIYTPIVFFLAVALVVVPYFVVGNYAFNDWLYRALVFLVISCPCALVISIPLGYFGGIGAASRHGILFKGSNYLDLMTKLNTVVMDKTGTLTEGVFQVQKVVSLSMDEPEMLKILSALERQSTHPIAKAIADFTKNEASPYQATEVVEISGHGLKGMVNGKMVLAGNTKLLQKFYLTYDADIDSIEETIVVVAIDKQYVGYVLIADKIKEDAASAVQDIHQNGVTKIVMLSGDKNAITQKVAQSVGIDTAFGDLLPEGKVQKVEELKQDKTRVIAFVGDGINDAPVLALSDVGIAMGAMGSDAAIETANVVIQTDQPSKIATAIKIGKATRSIVFQNIALAFGVKLIVLALGAGGLATMWEAVFADVGVALLAILNAVRIQKMNFLTTKKIEMNHKVIFINLLALAFLVNANAQSSLETVLGSVEKNNKSLVASRQFWEAKKLEFKTGLTLPNPTVQGQYLFGSPAAAGDQTDVFVVQPFDFPTTYKKRRELAAVQGAVSTSEIAARRQEVLQEAKLVCLEMVYRNKLAAQHERRKLDLEKLRGDFQTKLDRGDGNILDVNKTRLQLLEINQLQQENTVELQKLQTHLTELNGGEALFFRDTIYPPLPEIQAFEIVEKEYEAADPLRQTFEQEKRIAEKQLELSKAWRLPKFEAGYHYQGILGQRFNGIHAGVSLPIWEQKYRKEAQQTQVLFADLQLQSHLNEHFFEIKELYERQAALQKSLDEYRTAIASVSNTALLEKALRLGEITVIEYFLETSFYQNALLHFLKTEHEYHAAVAELMRYRL